jgi:hypothetical protein
MMEPTSFPKVFGTVFIPSMGITTSIPAVHLAFLEKELSFDLSPGDHPDDWRSNYFSDSRVAHLSGELRTLAKARFAALRRRLKRTETFRRFGETRMMEPTSFAKLLGTVFIPSLGITTSIQPFIWHFSKRSFSFDLSPRDHPRGCVPYFGESEVCNASSKVETH